MSSHVCRTCPYVSSSSTVTTPKRHVNIMRLFSCIMDNVVYCLLCTKCPLTVYIVGTGLACAWLHTRTSATCDSRADKDSQGWVIWTSAKRCDAVDWDQIGINWDQIGLQRKGKFFQPLSAPEARKPLVPVLLCITHHLKSGVLVALPTLFPPHVTARACTWISKKWVIHMKIKTWLRPLGPTVPFFKKNHPKMYSWLAKPAFNTETFMSSCV